MKNVNIYNLKFMWHYKKRLKIRQKYVRNIIFKITPLLSIHLADAIYFPLPWWSSRCVTTCLFPCLAPLVRPSCINICRLSVFNERTSSFNSRFSISCFFKVTSRTRSLDSRSAGSDTEAEMQDKRRNKLFILNALNVWSQQCYLFAMPTFSSTIDKNDLIKVDYSSQLIFLLINEHINKTISLLCSESTLKTNFPSASAYTYKNT